MYRTRSSALWAGVPPLSGIFTAGFLTLLHYSAMTVSTATVAVSLAVMVAVICFLKRKHDSATIIKVSTFIVK